MRKNSVQSGCVCWFISFQSLVDVSCNIILILVHGYPIINPIWTCGARLHTFSHLNSVLHFVSSTWLEIQQPVLPYNMTLLTNMACKVFFLNLLSFFPCLVWCTLHNVLNSLFSFINPILKHFVSMMLALTGPHLVQFWILISYSMLIQVFPKYNLSPFSIAVKNIGSDFNATMSTSLKQTKLLKLCQSFFPNQTNSKWN